MWNLLITVWAPLPLSLHYPFLHPAVWSAPPPWIMRLRSSQRNNKVEGIGPLWLCGKPDQSWTSYIDIN